jgi:UDP-glucose 4-epimerase
VLASVERVAGRRVPVNVQPRRAGDPPTLVARAQKIRTVLGWLPRLDDLDAIVQTSLRWEERLKREPW